VAGPNGGGNQRRGQRQPGRRGQPILGPEIETSGAHRGAATNPATTASQTATDSEAGRRLERHALRALRTFIDSVDVSITSEHRYDSEDAALLRSCTAEAGGTERRAGITRSGAAVCKRCEASGSHQSRCPFAAKRQRTR